MRVQVPVLPEATATARHVNMPLADYQFTDDKDLLANNGTMALGIIMAEYTRCTIKSESSFVLESVWNKYTGKDLLSWWKLLGTDHALLQAAIVFVIMTPLGLAARVRSFSDTASIQTQLRLRLSYWTLNKLLQICHIFRVLPEVALSNDSKLACETDFASDVVQVDGIEEDAGKGEDRHCSGS